MSVVRRPAALRAPLAAATAAVLALTLAGCSHSDNDEPRKPVDLGRSSPYEAAILKDGATALWPLRDADGLRPKDQIADLGPDKSVATVVGGTITGTSSPGGERGALFLRGGRIVTSVVSGMSSDDAFSVELQLRVDACTTAWGRVLGTTAQTKEGRVGMEIIHFPSQFAQNPCRLGVEFWNVKYLAGCHPSAVPPIGRWSQLTVTYAKSRVSCYENGVLIGSEALRAPATFSQPGPLGIGGSGSGFQGPLDGASISEVGFYDRVLTPAEIRAHAALLVAAEATPTPTATP